VTDVPFPVLSTKDPDAEGVLASWFVADGEQVAEGDLLAEVAVDKVDMEITAPAAGTVRLLVPEGEVARQGTVIARLD
jgi:pyruvate/2-oxoglutarate dehydrogenase complex dihydrolipoamide acyltransferase (E2) component